MVTVHIPPPTFEREIKGCSGLAGGGVNHYQPLLFHPTASIQLFYPRGSPEKLSNSEFTIAV